jgi:hypothetical protein
MVESLSGDEVMNLNFRQGENNVILARAQEKEQARRHDARRKIAAGGSYFAVLPEPVKFKDRLGDQHYRTGAASRASWD